MNKGIKFKDLSWPLKIAVIMAWVIGVLYILFFMVGFVTTVSGL